MHPEFRSAYNLRFFTKPGDAGPTDLSHAAKQRARCNELAIDGQVDMSAQVNQWRPYGCVVALILVVVVVQASPDIKTRFTYQVSKFVQLFKSDSSIVTVADK